jgi:hypothetical protein
VARSLDAFANSRLFGALLEPLPEATMVSDITDVLYVNYLLPAETLAPLVPEGLELQRLGPEGRFALMTFLSFRHGHFGAEMLGPLRKLCPSPIQTNWRIHVSDPRTKIQGIYFVTNAITSSVLALAARMMTEGMPMHVLASASLDREGETIRLRLEPGGGSAPDAQAELRDVEPPELAGAWRECWTTPMDFLAYCVPQDRAMASQPLRNRISRQEIHLGIPLTDCQFVEGTVSSRAASAIAGDARPICFRVPSVRFRFSQEAYDPIS